MLKETLILIKEMLIDLKIYKEKSNISPNNMIVNSYILINDSKKYKN